MAAVQGVLYSGGLVARELERLLELLLESLPAERLEVFKVVSMVQRPGSDWCTVLAAYVRWLEALPRFLHHGRGVQLVRRAVVDQGSDPS